MRLEPPPRDGVSVALFQEPTIAIALRGWPAAEREPLEGLALGGLAVLDPLDDQRELLADDRRCPLSWAAPSGAVSVTMPVAGIGALD